jgi:hypothetical protein
MRIAHKQTQGWSEPYRMALCFRNQLNGDLPGTELNPGPFIIAALEASNQLTLLYSYRSVPNLRSLAQDRNHGAARIHK